MAELVPATGPVTLLPQLTPDTPAMDHVPVPVGTAPPVGPVTTAVKVIASPKFAVEELAFTEIVGVLRAIVIENGVLKLSIPK